MAGKGEDRGEERSEGGEEGENSEWLLIECNGVT